MTPPFDMLAGSYCSGAGFGVKMKRLDATQNFGGGFPNLESGCLIS